MYRSKYCLSSNVDYWTLIDIMSQPAYLEARVLPGGSNRFTADGSRCKPGS